MKALYKKELMHFINNPVGYIVPSLFALLINYLFMKDVFVIGSASMKPFFSLVPWLLFLFVPALAMGSFSEEKRTNTIEVLLSLPISEASIVWAKWMALMTIYCLTLVLTFSITIVLGSLTPLYIPELISGYLGLFLLAASYLSFSLFISLLMSNQIASFTLSSLILFVLTGLSSDFLANLLPKTIQDILLFASPLFHMQNFAKGVVDFRSFVFFIGVFLSFMALSIMELKKRK